MKKFYIFALLMALTLNASALSKSKSRRYSLYLSDKMAYELDLTSIQYDAVYQINYDYFRSVYTDLDVEYYWPIRDDNMFYVLDPYQYRVYTYIDYFYNPLSYLGSSWYLDVYSYYPSRTLFYRDYPSVYRTYRGAYITNPGYYMYGTWAGPASYVNMHPSVMPPPPGQYNPHMDRHYEKFNNGTAARRGYTNPQNYNHGGSTRPGVNGGQPNTQQNFNGNGQPTNTNRPTNNYNTPTTNYGVSRAGNVPRNNNTSTQPATRSNQTTQPATRSNQTTQPTNTNRSVINRTTTESNVGNRNATTTPTNRTTTTTRSSRSTSNNSSTQQSTTTPTRSTGVSRSSSRSSSSSSSTPSSTSSSRRSTSSSYNSSSSSSSSSYSSSSRTTNTSRGGSVSSGRSSGSSSSGGTSRRR